MKHPVHPRSIRHQPSISNGYTCSKCGAAARFFGAGGVRSPQPLITAAPL